MDLHTLKLQDSSPKIALDFESKKNRGSTLGVTYRLQGRLDKEVRILQGEGKIC